MSPLDIADDVSLALSRGQRPLPSPTFAASFYRGYVIEPTPLGQLMFYPERYGAEEAVTSHACTIDDAVRQIDALEDGEPEEPVLTLHNVSFLIAVAALVLWSV